MPDAAEAHDFATMQAGGVYALALAGRDHECLDLGYRLLQTREPDGDLIVLMIRAMVRLGLGGPARELLQFARQRGVDLDVDALRAMLVSLPIGRMPWSACAPRFEANISALLAVQPELRDALPELHDTPREWQLVQTHAGEALLSRSHPHAVRLWNPGILNHSITASVALPGATPGTPMLVVGVGVNALVQHVVDHTATPPGAAGVMLLIVETDPVRAAAWLHTMDIVRLVENGRVRAFLGSNALQLFATFLATHADVDLPVNAVIPHWASAPGQDALRIVHSERARREETYHAICTRLQARASARSSCDLADRLAKPGAVILGFTSRFTTMLQYSTRDVGEALRECGYNFVLVSESDEQRTHSSLTIASAIEQHDPALVFMINHFRKERAGSMTGVPILTWIQDPTPLALNRSTGESIGPLDFVCGYYIEQCTGQFGYPASRFFSVCLPVSAHIFHDTPLSPDEAARYECDIMYVGHRHADASTHLQQWREKSSRELHPLYDLLHERIARLVEDGEPFNNPHALVTECAEKALLSLGPASIEPIASYFLVRLHDILYRAQTLRWIARWALRTGRTFRLYGKGWELDPVLAPFAQGPIAHGSSLRAAYRGARIVLQTLPAGFMHQRTFEGLASGSMVLARHSDTSSAAAHFPDVRRVIFSNEADLIEKCERYLADSELRARITNEMRAVVMRSFTYSAVMPQIIEFITMGLRKNA